MDVVIPTNSGDLPVFIVVPGRDGPWPCLVVLHEVGGMNEDLRNQTRRLAREGFLAAAPNLYYRGQNDEMFVRYSARPKDKKRCDLRRCRSRSNVADSAREMHGENWCYRILHGR
jgi:dienelactone hydrolase